MLRRLLLCGLFFLGGCAAPAQKGPQEIHLVPVADEERPFAFEPATLTVPAGTTVRWVNDREVFHTVTFSDSLEPRIANGAFERALFRVGEIAEFTFATPGTYHYFCQPHAAFMFGTVVVTASR